jgi:hypothetical protein
VGIVSSPNDAPTAAAPADKIALTPTTIVTVLAPAVLSTTNSKIVPPVAPNSAPKRVPVGNVILVPAADVEVIYPVATSAAVAAAVALIAAAVGSVRKPLSDTTGPENVVRAMIFSPYKVKLICLVCVCWGSHDKLVVPRWLIILYLVTLCYIKKEINNAIVGVTGNKAVNNNNLAIRVFDIILMLPP